jgi:hypothetical protein
VTDVDGLLRNALHRHAEEAPGAGNLLIAVHARSRRLARRRRLTVAAVAAVSLAVAGPVFAAGARNGAQPASTPDTVPVASPDPASPSPSASPAPGHPPTSGVPFRLVPPAAPPVFPFRPDVAPTGGLAPPVVTLAAGELTAYYAAKDPVRGADVTIRVGPRPPSFDAPADRAGPVHETAQQVRGHPATLRTVTVAPANRLSLYWQETPGQWVRVDTDDTLTDAEVVRLADALAPATVPVVAPFRPDLVPAGMDLDTSSRSVMAFRPHGESAIVRCTLIRAQPLVGPTVALGGYRATLRRASGAATLTVAIDDRHANLVVQVPARYPVSDADLIRFAAGIHLTEDAEPQP